MLKECFSAKHTKNSTRRWFSDDYFDLIVWMRPEDAIVGFQLCYDKNRSERALTWSKKHGFTHERVDDGEANPAKNLTPILVPDGMCPIQELIERFRSASADMDPGIRSFVSATLKEYSSTLAAP